MGRKRLGTPRARDDGSLAPHGHTRMADESGRGVAGLACGIDNLRTRDGSVSQVPSHAYPMLNIPGFAAWITARRRVPATVG